MYMVAAAEDLPLGLKETDPAYYNPWIQNFAGTYFTPLFAITPGRSEMGFGSKVN